MLIWQFPCKWWVPLLRMVRGGWQVVEGGHAAKAGQVQVGDVLEACSATILKAGKEGAYAKEGHGKRIKRPMLCHPRLIA